MSRIRKGNTVSLVYGGSASVLQVSDKGDRYFISYRTHTGDLVERWVDDSEIDNPQLSIDKQVTSDILWVLGLESGRQ